VTDILCRAERARRGDTAPRAEAAIQARTPALDLGTPRGYALLLAVTLRLAARPGEHYGRTLSLPASVLVSAGLWTRGQRARVVGSNAILQAVRCRTSDGRGGGDEPERALFSCSRHPWQLDPASRLLLTDEGRSVADRLLACEVLAAGLQASRYRAAVEEARAAWAVIPEAAHRIRAKRGAGEGEEAP